MAPPTMLRKEAGSFPDLSSRSARLSERARKVMPGGLTRSSIHWPPYQIYAASGAGSRVIDADGVERIDFQNNYTSLIHGHAHPQVTEKLIEQARRGTVFGLTSEPEIRLAELLCERVPSFERIRFCNSGTEATLNLVKAARAYTGRPKIAKTEGAYHGTSEFMEVSVNTDPQSWGPIDAPSRVASSQGTPQAVLDNVVVIPFNDPQRALALLEQSKDELAGVVIDLSPLRCGLPRASRPFLDMLQAFCRRSGALLLSDEVLNFRLGYGGAHGEFDVKPDLTAIGKIIGGGLPVGGVAGRADVMDVFNMSIGAKVSHGGTFNGNPLTMTAGHAAMELFTRDALEHLNRMGERLREKVAAAFKSAGVAGQVVGLGSLFRILFHTREYHDYRGYLQTAPEVEQGERLMRWIINNGFLITRMGAGCLSTANTEAEIDRFAEVVHDGLRAMAPESVAAD
ncbi:MAG: aspartate aminotransferase family protein [Burkholderiaceae bacterium]|nr:aspartate aminotransferase family protein [Burkholderiaceae bacterium]